MNGLLGTTLVSMASALLVTAVHAADEYYVPPVKHPVQVYFGGTPVPGVTSWDWSRLIVLPAVQRLLRPRDSRPN